MDAIDTLARIEPGSTLDALRRRKPVTRNNAQASFDALFGAEARLPLRERAAVALFVAGLQTDEPGQTLYGAMLADEPLHAAIAAEFKHAATTGPYGAFPAGPLTREDLAGPSYTISAAGRAALGARLAAAFEQAHMLVFHPRDATPGAIRTLEAVGWSTPDIVTLSQLVAFLSFQLRAAHGLRALAGSLA
ncbi:CMD domain protein [Acidisphaera sp. L21]|uniref:CMD domain protein n=1 Tax=Acidisphaera sp. L21 TaxID=1641851 RepID=UPI0020B170FC|nr:CMD domain protein [Acidisphaera sp. L21]